MHSRYRNVRPAKTLDVSLVITINAPRAKVWKALLTETHLWWRKDFYTSPNTKAFRIEPKLGGRVYEDYGNGNGAIWFTINLLDAPSRLQWAGHMGGSFPGPISTLVEINLTETAGVTTLRLTDQLIGKIDDKTRTSLVEGWQLLMGDSLKKHVEKSRARKSRSAGK